MEVQLETTTIHTDNRSGAQKHVIRLRDAQILGFIWDLH